MIPPEKLSEWKAICDGAPVDIWHAPALRGDSHYVVAACLAFPLLLKEVALLNVVLEAAEGLITEPFCGQTNCDLRFIREYPLLKKALRNAKEPVTNV